MTNAMRERVRFETERAMVDLHPPLRHRNECNDETWRLDDLMHEIERILEGR